MCDGVNCACSAQTEEEKIQQIEALIEDYVGHEENLIQALHMAQSVYGHLPIHIQTLVAEKMELPLSKVSGVISFYSYFTTQPKGRHTIGVCMGTACYVRGGKKILQKLRELLKIDVAETTEDGKFSLEVMRCIGACGLAPAIMIDDKVYKQVNPDKLNEILEAYE